MAFTPRPSHTPHTPRPAREILADLQALERQNDQLEHHLALATQSLKAAEVRMDRPDRLLVYLDRAKSQLRRAS